MKTTEGNTIISIIRLSIEDIPIPILRAAFLGFTYPHGILSIENIAFTPLIQANVVDDTGTPLFGLDETIKAILLEINSKTKIDS